MRRPAERRFPVPRPLVTWLGCVVTLVSGFAADAARADEVARAPRDPAPARLAVDAPAGAEIRVDGVVVGTMPLTTPIEADPGKHRVVVLANGNHPFVHDVLLSRGKTTTLVADLDGTGQRSASWALIATGASAVGVAVGFGVASVVEHRRARDLERGPDTLPASVQAEYDAAIAARDDYRLVSGIVGGAGLAAFLTGAFLFAFDMPDAPADDTGLEVWPLVAPGFAGAFTTLRF